MYATPALGFIMHGKQALLASLLFLSTRAWAKDADQLTKMIDQRAYQEVLNLFPQNPTGAEANLIFRGYALLGIGGFEPLAIFSQIRQPQTFHDPILRELYTSSIPDVRTECPNHILPTNMKGANRCLILRLFNQIPKHSSPQLQAALRTFRLLFDQKRLGRQDSVLLAILELSFIFSKAREAFMIYERLDEENISDTEVAELYALIRSTAENTERLLLHYDECTILMSKKLVGSKINLLFEKNAKGKIEFLNESGLKTFMSVTDIENIDTTAIAGRNIIIQALDQLHNYLSQDDYRVNF